MATFADVDRIFAKYNGKQVDRDGYPPAQPYQCHDWAAQYSAEIGGPGFIPTPVTGGARDAYEQWGRPEMAAVRAFYDRIPNTPEFVPRKGDVPVWGPRNNNPYGHIAVATGEGDTNWFNSYDQNWNTPRVTLVRHDYSGLLGVLRPKNLTSNVGEPPMNDQQKKDAYNIVLQRNPEVAKADGRTAMQFIYDARGELKAQRDAAAKALADRDAQIKSQQDQINALNEKLKQGGLPQETVDQVKETNTIVKWIKAKLEGIFK